jgi:hypothetical protein
MKFAHIIQQVGEIGKSGILEAKTPLVKRRVML